MGKEGVILEHHVDVPFVRRQFGNVFAIQDDLARRRCFQTGDHAQQGCLAAARRTEQRHEFPVFYGEVQFRDDDMVPKLFGDSLQTDQIFHLSHVTTFLR